MQVNPLQEKYKTESFSGIPMEINGYDLIDTTAAVREGDAPLPSLPVYTSSTHSLHMTCRQTAPLSSHWNISDIIYHITGIPPV